MQEKNLTHTLLEEFWIGITRYAALNLKKRNQRGKRSLLSGRKLPGAVLHHFTPTAPV